MTIFLDDTDYRQFVHLLGEVVEEFELECWNFCVMPNHYHATLKPTRPNLSDAVRRLNGVYAQWWNKRHSRVGHVFQGRFKDQIVDRDDYLLTLTRYVVRNPVRAGLVQQPEEWPWSSYTATAGLSSPPAFLATASTLSLFGTGDRPSLQERFVEYVLSHEEDTGKVDRIRSSERTLGDRTFKLAIRALASSSNDEDGGIVPSPPVADVTHLPG